MPLTLTVSSVIAVMSASEACVCPERLRRTLPTRYVRYMKNGSRPSDSRVSRQSMKVIAMTVVMTITRFEKTLLAVSVTTD